MANENDLRNLSGKKENGSSIQDCYVRLNRMDAKLLKYYLKKYRLKLHNHHQNNLSVSNFQSVPSAKKLKVDQDVLVEKNSNSCGDSKPNVVKWPIDKNNLCDSREGRTNLINQKHEERQNTTENDCKAILKKTSSLVGVLQDRQTNVDDFSLNDKKHEVDEMKNFGVDTPKVMNAGGNEVKENERGKNCVSEKRVEIIHEKTRLKNDNEISVAKSNELKRKVIELVVVDNDTYLESDRRTGGRNQITERLKKNVINSVNDKKIVKEKSCDSNKIIEKKQLDEVEKIITEISHLVKNLHNSDLLIQSLKEDMKHHLDLQDHFTKVIISQKEKFRKEIWKSQETIMKGYDKLMSKCANPSDVTLRISRKSHLSIEEVDSVISQCILVEDRCHSEREKQKEETERNVGGRFVEKCAAGDFSVDYSQSLKMIRTNIQEEINGQLRSPQESSALQQPNTLRRLLSGSACQQYLPLQVPQMNFVPNEKLPQVRVNYQQMPHFNCQTDKISRPLMPSKLSNLPPVSSDYQYHQYFQLPPSYRQTELRSGSPYYSLTPASIKGKYPVSIANVQPYLNLHRKDASVISAPISSENMLHISRADTATLYSTAGVCPRPVPQPQLEPAQSTIRQQLQPSQQSIPRSQLPLQQPLISKPLASQQSVILAPLPLHHSTMPPSQTVFRPQIPPRIVTPTHLSPPAPRTVIRTHLPLPLSPTVTRKQLMPTPPTVIGTQVPLSSPQANTQVQLPRRTELPVINTQLPLPQPQAVAQTQLLAPPPQTIIGTQLPPQSVNGTQLPAQSVMGTQLPAQSVMGTQLSPQAVIRTQLPPQSVIGTRLPPQTIICAQLPSSPSQEVIQIQLPSPQRALLPQCVTQQPSSPPPVTSSPEIIHDPTVPQKLMLKDRRLQAGDIIKLPEAVVSEQTKKEGSEEEDDVQIVESSLEDEGKTTSRTRTVLCAQAGCRNAGIRICKECRSVIYCSGDCQLKHWKLKHKVECGKLKQLRDE